MASKMKLKKGDKVVVISGKDKGKSGEITKMIPTENRAIVQGVNLVKRHTKPTQDNPGGIIPKEATIHVSNLAVEDPKNGSASRVGYRFEKDGSKIRFAKKSGEVING
ncbi:MAG: 50S ribosomal protein L24 [Sphingomonadales bacterium]|jgi:large subunit ribosomal protein L24